MDVNNQDQTPQGENTSEVPMGKATEEEEKVEETTEVNHHDDTGNPVPPEHLDLGPRSERAKMWLGIAGVFGAFFVIFATLGNIDSYPDLKKGWKIAVGVTACVGIVLFLMGVVLMGVSATSVRRARPLSDKIRARNMDRQFKSGAALMVLSGAVLFVALIISYTAPTEPKLSCPIDVGKPEIFYYADGSTELQSTIRLLNSHEFPQEMFAEALGIGKPTCSETTVASRAWVRVYNEANGSVLAEYCHFTEPPLVIAFAATPSTTSYSVYVVIHDRACGKSYQSASIEIIPKTPLPMPLVTPSPTAQAPGTPEPNPSPATLDPATGSITFEPTPEPAAQFLPDVDQRLYIQTFAATAACGTGYVQCGDTGHTYEAAMSANHNPFWISVIVARSTGETVERLDIDAFSVSTFTVPAGGGAFGICDSSVCGSNRFSNLSSYYIIWLDRIPAGNWNAGTFHSRLG